MLLIPYACNRMLTRFTAALLEDKQQKEPGAAVAYQHSAHEAHPRDERREPFLRKQFL
jgi:hypothetical protein